MAQPDRGHDEQVRLGFDAAAERYAAERDQFQNREYLERFVELLPTPATVLDVGCGAGTPIDNFLVDHGYNVIGIDVSPNQIALAKQAVPGARYEVRNMLDLEPAELEVDGIVSFYAIFHTKRESHGELLRTLASFLKPEGTLLITMGAGEWEGSEQFHGVEMFWSHFGRERNRELVEAAGLDVVVDEIDESNDERHQVVIARKRG